MKIAVIGTGMVGQNIASRLDELGHTVEIATRNAAETAQRDEANAMTGISFKQWHQDHPKINLVNFGDVNADTELFVNATGGMVSIDALNLVGEDKMNDKILVDISNPLDFSNGFPPTLSVCNDDSLGEQIQAEFPSVHVVKTLNTMTTALMTHPNKLAGHHNVFVSGNDSGAKSKVKSLLNSMEWNDDQIIDLGDITTSRGVEMVLPIWLRLYGTIGQPIFNFAINTQMN